MRGEVVSLPQGFGNAVTSETVLNDFAGTFEVGQVAGRNIDGFDSVPGAEYVTHHFLSKNERGIASSMKVQRGVFSAESLFGAAHRRNSQAKAEMRCQTEFARMSDSLTVAQENVRWALQASVSFQQRGNFTKGEQPGDIREEDR